VKIKELLQEAPEMTEENLLNIIQDNLPLLRDYNLLKRVQECNKGLEINKAVLAEFDKIHDKQSYLTSSQRKFLQGFVGFCMIRMTKGDKGNGQPSSND
jgi:hypothetical protein